MIDIDTYTLLF